MLAANDLSGDNRTISFVTTPDRMVPFALEFIAPDDDLGHLLVGHHNPLVIAACVELTPHGQAGFWSSWR